MFTLPLDSQALRPATDADILDVARALDDPHALAEEVCSPSTRANHLAQAERDRVESICYQRHALRPCGGCGAQLGSDRVEVRTVHGRNEWARSIALCRASRYPNGPKLSCLAKVQGELMATCPGCGGSLWQTAGERLCERCQTRIGAAVATEAEQVKVAEKELWNDVYSPFKAVSGLRLRSDERAQYKHVLRGLLAAVSSEPNPRQLLCADPVVATEPHRAEAVRAVAAELGKLGKEVEAALTAARAAGRDEGQSFLVRAAQGDVSDLEMLSGYAARNSEDVK